MTVGAKPEEAALPPALLPLDLMLSVVRDENLPLEVRLTAARWSAPYCHHHKGQVDVNGISQPLVVQIVKFSPEASEPAVVIEHEKPRVPAEAAEHAKPTSTTEQPCC